MLRLAKVDLNLKSYSKKRLLDSVIIFVQLRNKSFKTLKLLKKHSFWSFHKLGTTI